MTAYDPARYLDVENVDQAVEIILSPTEGMTAQQRWNDETPALMHIIRKHIAPDGFVLDYGCGIGRLAKPLIEEMHCKVVGIDISRKMRALATSLVDSPMFCAIDPALFDLIRVLCDSAIAVWSLQHCLDLHDAIERIKYSLIPGGKLVVVNDRRRALPIDDGGWGDDGQDVRAMIEAAGFKELESGILDESVAPGWMQKDTFWAAYRKDLGNNNERIRPWPYLQLLKPPS